MPTWVSLLRAINLGKRNQVPMPALREALANAGFSDVRTYVQSGNVIARSPHRTPAKVAERITALVKDEFGLDVPVIVRGPEQLDQVIAANPYPVAAAERPTILHVMFLACVPKADAVQELHTDEMTKDVCRVVGDNLYIDYGTGVHGNRLTAAYLSKRLGVDGTARNWRTVTTLAEMARPARR